ncbi:hypothetical protein BN1708_017006, partial [Verticillium longisporum]
MNVNSEEQTKELFDPEYRGKITKIEKWGNSNKVDGIVVDESFKPDLSDDEVIKLYKDMVYISIMDLIMFDAQRQGRLSFYMVSAGEEALSVGSASVLAPEDVVFCQYREQGVFKQRG